jgi:hypothetical protein
MGKEGVESAPMLESFDIHLVHMQHRFLEEERFQEIGP